MTALKQHPITRMVRNGRVTPAQSEACMELQSLAEIETRGVKVRTSTVIKINPNVSGRNPAKDAAYIAQIKKVFDRWLALLGDDAQMLTEMAEGADTFTVISRRYHLHLMTARDRFIASIDLWISLRATLDVGQAA